MPRDRRWLSALLVIALPLASEARAQSSATPRPADAAPAEVVGRWVLVATIRNGEDVTQAGVTQGGDALVYEFKADGTFSITRGERLSETGIWSANENVVPKTFDHRRYVDGQLGRLLPGIYETGGDVLKMCLFPPSASNTRPTRCEAKAENRSSIYIMKRETK